MVEERNTDRSLPAICPICLISPISSPPHRLLSPISPICSISPILSDVAPTCLIWRSPTWLPMRPRPSDPSDLSDLCDLALSHAGPASGTRPTLTGPIRPIWPSPRPLQALAQAPRPSDPYDPLSPHEAYYQDLEERSHEISSFTPVFPQNYISKGRRVP